MELTRLVPKNLKIPTEEIPVRSLFQRIRDFILGRKEDAYITGLRCYRQGNYEKAWFKFWNATQTYSNHVPAALFALGVMCNLGQGFALVNRNKAAVYFYKEAAQLHHMDATYNLATSYLQGTGVLEDHEMARSYYHRMGKCKEGSFGIFISHLTTPNPLDLDPTVAKCGPGRRPLKAIFLLKPS